MPFLTPADANAIAEYFYKVDCQVRKDLSAGHVVSERDYLSRFITLLQYPFGILGRGPLPFTGQFFSNNFSVGNEQTFGCDSFFVFRYKNRVKVLAVEGKYPRFGQSTYPWDKPQNANTPSRFSAQIGKQKLLANAGVLVLEMFLHNGLSHVSHLRANLDAMGSSLVTRKIANDIKINIKTDNLLDHRRPIVWKTRDAVNAINRQYNSTADISIRYFLNKLLICELGEPIVIKEGATSFTIPIEKFPDGLNFPLPPINIAQDKIPGKEVVAFMNKHGLRHLGYIDVEEKQDMFI